MHRTAWPVWHILLAFPSNSILPPSPYFPPFPKHCPNCVRSTLECGGSSHRFSLNSQQSFFCMTVAKNRCRRLPRRLSISVLTTAGKRQLLLPPLFSQFTAIVHLPHPHEKATPTCALALATVPYWAWSESGGCCHRTPDASRTDPACGEPSTSIPFGRSVQSGVLFTSSSHWPRLESSGSSHRTQNLQSVEIRTAFPRSVPSDSALL
jgi:hypothetical protein